MIDHAEHADEGEHDREDTKRAEKHGQEPRLPEHALEWLQRAHIHLRPWLDLVHDGANLFEGDLGTVRPKDDGERREGRRRA